MAVGPRLLLASARHYIQRVAGQWGLEWWFSLSSFLAATAIAETDISPPMSPHYDYIPSPHHILCNARGATREYKGASKDERQHRVDTRQRKMRPRCWRLKGLGRTAPTLPGHRCTGPWVKLVTVCAREQWCWDMPNHACRGDASRCNKEGQDAYGLDSKCSETNF